MIIATVKPLEDIFAAYRAYIEGKTLVFQILRKNDQLYTLNRETGAIACGTLKTKDLDYFLHRDDKRLKSALDTKDFAREEVLLRKNLKAGTPREQQLLETARAALLDGTLPMSCIWEVRFVANAWWRNIDWEAVNNKAVSPILCAISSYPIEIFKTSSVSLGCLTGYTEEWNDKQLEVTFWIDSTPFGYAYRLNSIDEV